jgi:hypothetical protein
MRAIFVVAIMAVLAPQADAGKPKAAAAKAALDAWAKALVKGEPDKKNFEPIVKLTSTPFRVLVEDEDGLKCDVTVGERAKVIDAIDCARLGAAVAPFKPYNAKVLKNLWGKVKGAKTEIEALDKTHALFVHEASGEDVSELAIVAITNDADGTARVSHVFSSYLTK